MIQCFFWGADSGVDEQDEVGCRVTIQACAALQEMDGDERAEQQTWDPHLQPVMQWDLLEGGGGPVPTYKRAVGQV